MDSIKFLIDSIEDISSRKPTLTDYLALRAFVEAEFARLAVAHNDPNFTLSKEKTIYFELVQQVSVDLSNPNYCGIDGAVFNASSSARLLAHRLELDKE